MQATKTDTIELVWLYFNEITKIPRASKKEELIRNYLLKFAHTHQLTVATDKAGNVLIRKAASSDKEDAVGVVLQSHMDMVCEKNSDSKHNFDTDPITTIINGDWMGAKDTTLGADNGIGMAMQLAILANNSLSHPALECLFTTDEETGLYGASHLNPDFLKHNILINLDSEEEGEFCIGCAGGMDTLATIPIETEVTPENFFFFKVKISNLQGGHSGEDIHKGRANAIKLLIEYLSILQTKTDIRIVEINGGNLRNAIPREAEALLAVPYKDKELVRVEINHFTVEVENQYKDSEKNIRFELDSWEAGNMLWTKNCTEKIIQSLVDCPHGVIAMNKNIPNLVETSTNLAAIHTLENVVFIETSQRSSIESDKKALAEKITKLFSQIGAAIKTGKDYPGWKPNLDSTILKKCKKSYHKQFNKAPIIKTIHAGLECGVIGEKYPHMDMISFGPTIENPHSPSERVQISSVKKCMLLLLAVLKNL